MSERYVAFLRAINVGGRVVKMDELRRIFESLKFANVATVIASGNVLFASRRASESALEGRIAKALEAALGYAVPTFVRNTSDMLALAERQPFTPAQVKSAVSRHVAFLGHELDAPARKRLAAIETDFEKFIAVGREIHCLARRGLSKSTITPVAFDRAIGQPSTWRNVNTVAKIAARLATNP